jgi:hypothetical protein
MLGVATANLLLGNDPEALEWAKKVYFDGARLPIWGYYMLVACLAHGGQPQLATEAVAALLKIDSSETLHTVRYFYEREVRWRRPQDIDRIITGLRIAGLPE